MSVALKHRKISDFGLIRAIEHFCSCIEYKATYTVTLNLNDNSTLKYGNEHNTNIEVFQIESKILNNEIGVIKSLSCYINLFNDDHETELIVIDIKVDGKEYTINLNFHKSNKKFNLTDNSLGILFKDSLNTFDHDLDSLAEKDALINHLEKTISELKHIAQRREGSFLDREADMAELLRQRERLLEDSYSRRYEELEKKYSQRLKDLDEREELLNKKRSEFSATNTQFRRNIREDIKGTIQDRLLKEELISKDIRKERRVNISVFSIVLTIMSILFVYTFLFESKSVSLSNNLLSTSNIVFLTKLVSSLTGLVLMIVYFIRWNDRWFEKLADEELKLRQTYLDIDRGSWLVETALEWDNATSGESQIPEVLASQLSNNLFKFNSHVHRATHPTEDVIKAILNASASLNLKTPVGDLSLDNKGVKKATKEIEKVVGK